MQTFSFFGRHDVADGYLPIRKQKTFDRPIGQLIVPLNVSNVNDSSMTKKRLSMVMVRRRKKRGK